MSQWHRVTTRDRKRIRCLACDRAGLSRPAEVCQHAAWNTGNTLGLSFFYYCLTHGVERGFSRLRIAATVKNVTRSEA